jgi:4-diphosphocytidyl-2-C-methyl-D-erythritol kinase
MTRAQAFAKINLAHVVGPLRPDGRHEVVSVLQRIDLHDVIELAQSSDGETIVEGFADDTIVRDALQAFAAATGAERGWHVRIEKRIPVAAGLGGGSSDAAAALTLANGLVSTPVPQDGLRELAASLGADVPFFLSPGAQLATGYGERLERLDLPEDFAVLVVLPEGEHKISSADVYRRFDERAGEQGYDARRKALREVVAHIESAADLAELPGNDLASSSLAPELVRLGAFRADVTGAGPAVYGLFAREEDATRAAAELGGVERTWLSRPVSGL